MHRRKQRRERRERGSARARGAGVWLWGATALALACGPGDASKSTTPASPPAAAASAPSAAAPAAPAAPAASTRSDPAPRAGDVQKGRQLYVTNCGVCHNTDPTKAGTLGPEIAGAARELVVARVLHGSYPQGYAPKRPTKNMVALPHLAPVVDDIAAYLASVKP